MSEFSFNQILAVFSRRQYILFFALLCGIMLLFLGFRLIRVENLLLAVTAILGLTIISRIAIRNFFTLILIVFVISLAFPLIARFGPEELMKLQSLGKLAILGIGVVMWLGSLILGRSLIVSRAMLLFILSFLISVIFFSLHVFNDLMTGVELSKVLELFRVFGFPYIVLAIVTYDLTRDLRWVLNFTKILVVAGVLVGGFGVFQWILGPDRLRALGMNLTIGLEEFHFTSDPTTGLAFFRTFSSLSNHYDLSAFMVLTFLAALYFYWIGKIRSWPALVSIGVMGLALLTTRNNTGWFVLIMAIALALLTSENGLLRRISELRLSRQMLLTISFVGILILIVLLRPEFRVRILNSLSFNEGKSPSLLPRIYFLGNSIEAFSARPWGWGSNVDAIPYSISRDLYLIYLFVVGGVFVFVFYAFLYIQPAIYGWSVLKRLRNYPRSLYVFYCVLWAWITSGALIGTFSNSQVTNASPSNILFWCGVGLVFKIPHLARQASEESWER